MTLEARLVQVIQAIGADVKALRSTSTEPTPGTKTLGYTNGKLTSVNGPGAATKSLTYSGNVFTSVSSVNAGVTVTKNLGYAGAALTTIETVIT